MKHFNKLRDKLRPEHTELPDGFGWEDMQDGIFEKIEDDTPVVPPTSSILKNGIILGLSVLVCILAASLFYIVKSDSTYADEVVRQQNTKNETTDLVVNNNEEENTNAIIKNESSSSIEDVPNTPNNNPQTTQVEINQRNENSSSNEQSSATQRANKPINQNEYSNENESAIQSKSTYASTSGISNSKPIPNTISKRKTSRSVGNAEMLLPSESSVVDNDDTAIPNEEVSKRNSNQLQNTQNTVSTIGSIPNTDINESKSQLQSAGNDQDLAAPIELKNAAKETFSFPFIETLSSKVVPQNVQEKLDNPKPSSPPVVEVVQEKKWTAEIGGGWNLWSHGIDNSIYEGNIHQDTEAGQGFSFSARIARKLNGNVSLQSGLDYDIIYNNFNTSFTHLRGREVENAPVNYLINPISGDTTINRGTVTVVDTVTTTIVHYNKFQTVSIPLMVNYEMHRGPWALGIGIGPSFSFLTNYSGRYLHDNAVVDYDTSANIYSTSPKVAMNASFSIHRNLTSSLYIGGRVDIKNHFSNWGTENGNGLKPRIIGGQIVLGTRF